MEMKRIRLPKVGDTVTVDGRKCVLTFIDKPWIRNDGKMADFLIRVSFDGESYGEFKRFSEIQKF